MECLARVAWQHQNAAMVADSQKAELWRLLDPSPYEIVEVELI